MIFIYVQKAFPGAKYTGISKPVLAVEHDGQVTYCSEVLFFDYCRLTTAEDSDERPQASGITAWVETEDIDNVGLVGIMTEAEARRYNIGEV